MRILLDAMGGDNAPQAIVKGAVMAAAKTEDQIILVGAKEVIGNDEAPVKAIKTKKESTIVTAFNILRDGFADAFVSAGSTGALLAGGLLICGRIKGIERPAICSLYPTLGGKVCLLVDAGANAECKPRNLCEFGLMGSIYMEQVIGRANPAVALANIGAEAEKGTPLTKKAYELLSESGLNFTGNIEARDIPAGACDVIVADGFTGNIILKLSEGMFAQMVGLMKQKLPKEMIAALASRTDYSEYGGAPILGITKPVIKMHGSSGPKAVMNAVLKASEFASQNVIGQIEANIK